MGDTYNPLTKLVNGDENFFVMLKDGTRIDFFQQIGADDTAELTADSPIVLEEVDYLQLSDGTRLYPPSNKYCRIRFFPGRFFHFPFSQKSAIL